MKSERKERWDGISGLCKTRRSEGSLVFVWSTIFRPRAVVMEEVHGPKECWMGWLYKASSSTWPEGNDYTLPETNRSGRMRLSSNGCRKLIKKKKNGKLIKTPLFRFLFKTPSEKSNPFRSSKPRQVQRPWPVEIFFYLFFQKMKP